VSTDWGGLLGTVIIAGVAMKATDALFGKAKGGKKSKGYKGQARPF